MLDNQREVEADAQDLYFEESYTKPPGYHPPPTPPPGTQEQYTAENNWGF